MIIVHIYVYINNIELNKQIYVYTALKKKLDVLDNV